jgi:hypothetical protein
VGIQMPGATSMKISWTMDTTKRKCWVHNVTWFHPSWISRVALSAGCSVSYNASKAGKVNGKKLKGRVQPFQYTNWLAFATHLFAESRNA